MELPRGSLPNFISAIHYAETTCSAHGHTTLHPIHIGIGLLNANSDSDQGLDILRLLGVDLATLRRKMEEALIFVKEGEDMTKALLRDAVSVSKTGAMSVGTEHLLIALSRTNGPFSHELSAFGIQTSDILTAVYKENWSDTNVPHINVLNREVQARLNDLKPVTFGTQRREYPLREFATVETMFLGHFAPFSPTNAARFQVCQIGGIVNDNLFGRAIGSAYVDRVFGNWLATEFTFKGAGITRKLTLDEMGEVEFSLLGANVKVTKRLASLILSSLEAGKSGVLNADVMREVISTAAKAEYQ